MPSRPLLHYKARWAAQSKEEAVAQGQDGMIPHDLMKTKGSILRFRNHSGHAMQIADVPQGSSVAAPRWWDEEVACAATAGYPTRHRYFHEFQAQWPTS